MKKALFFLLCLFAFTANSCYAQPYFHKQWDKRFGGNNYDAFESFQETSDNGYILGGFSMSGITGDKTQNSWDTTIYFSDYWIIKVDSFGNKQWDRRFGGTGDDNLGMIKQTKDRGYILCGQSSSSNTGDKSQMKWGSYDTWIVKIDSFGNKLWDKRYGGILYEMFGRIIETKDNGYLLATTTTSPVSGDKTEVNWDTANFYSDMWIVKIDSLGNKLWDKRYGGIKDDAFGSIIQTDDNGYILAGASNSGIGGDRTESNWDVSSSATSDAWLVKIDSLGNKQWDKRYGGSKDDGFGFVMSITDGYILLGGSESVDDGNKMDSKKGYWLVKVDSLGNKQWDKAYDGGYSIGGFSKTMDNGYLLSGRSNSNAVGDKTENNLGSIQIWVVKTDSIGNKEWDKTVFTTKYSEGYAIQTTDGCYAVGAFTASGVGGYKTQTNWDSTEVTYDYWIMKFCMDTVTGVTEITNQPRISVYPNPFTSDISISLQKENLQEATFTITNAMGQVIYKKEETNLSSNYTKVLDLSYLPNGIYFVVVTIKGESTAKRVVKE